MYEMKSRQIPFHDGYDVIVAGGGPAGCAAAASAAREGARTLLIEASGALGGMGTNGLIPFWCGFSNGGPLCSTGMGKRVMEALQQQMPHIKPGTKGGAINAEALKRVYDDLVADSGAEVLFNTQLCGVDADESGRVNAIIVSNKAGLSAYRAKVYADCTGDADLTAWAGGEFELGDELGEMQPSTLCFMLTNVDLYAYHAMGRRGRIISPDEKYPLIIDEHSPNSVVGPGAVGFNAGHIHGVDNTRPETVSAALMRGRKLALQIRDQLAERYPEVYGNAFLAATASLMGVREGRRIKADYMVTEADYKSRRTFPDEICRNCYGFDSHETKGEMDKIKEGKMGANEPGEVVFEAGESHGIPYRSLLPQKLVNVIVAGRSIGAERRAFGSIRVMANCLSMGEAAGMAAAYAADSPDHDVHQVDVARLRARLLEEGAYIQ